MNDKFDIVDLYKFYSKNILKESKRQPLSEKEVVRDTFKGKIGPFKKVNAILYYDDDPAMLPASFQVDYLYKIIFLSDAIREDFSEEKIDFGKEIDISDDEIEKMAMKGLKQQNSPAPVKKELAVDLQKFYHEFFKKNLPSFVISGKLNDLIRAGVVPIDDWKIYAVTYSRQTDDKLLFRKLEEGMKKNRPQIPVDYGYQIAFESTQRTKVYSEAEIIDFVTRFTEALETSLFKDTKYYKIIKK